MLFLLFANLLHYRSITGYFNKMTEFGCFTKKGGLSSSNFWRLKSKQSGASSERTPDWLTSLHTDHVCSKESCHVIGVRDSTGQPGGSPGDWGAVEGCPLMGG